MKAGLTPYEALSAATRAPGEFIARNVPRAERFGTVTQGLRADLVLVERNPLTSLETLEAPLGVMKADAVQRLRNQPRGELSHHPRADQTACEKVEKDRPVLQHC